MVELYIGDPELTARALIGAAVKSALREKNTLFVGFGRDCPDFGRLPEISRFITVLKPQNGSVIDYFDSAVRMAITFKYSSLILDGILDLADGGVIPSSQLMEFISDAPDSMEIICTGENADERFVRLADEAVGFTPLSE